MLYLCYRV